MIFLYKVLISGDDVLFDLQDKYWQWLKVWPLAANRPGFKSHRLACYQPRGFLPAATSLQEEDANTHRTVGCKDQVRSRW